MDRRRRTIAGIGTAIVLVAVGVTLGDSLRAAGFVIRAAGMQGFVRHVAELTMDPVRLERLTVPSRAGDMPARLYLPAMPTKRAILLVPGVHATGVDEPRLDDLARNLAGMGHRVLSIGPPDLTRYSITPRTTDMIEDGARWWAARSGPIGLIGISFGGGLSIVAASRLSDVAWVLSFGGHGDLPRTLRYLCTGNQPDGSHRPPHDYGVVIILLSFADKVVPADQVAPLRHGLFTFLEASHLDMVDKPRAAETFERAKTLAAALPEPARTFMTWVNTRDVAHLGPALLPHLESMADTPSLSPERNPPPRAPVYLLHGTDDNVIPAVESRLLAESLRRRGGTAVQLATPLITHAEVERMPTAAEIWHLVRFWAGPL